MSLAIGHSGFKESVDRKPWERKNNELFIWRQDKNFIRKNTKVFFYFLIN